jgi:hypothetical protein
MENNFINRRIMEEMQKYSRNGELTISDANDFLKRFRFRKNDLMPIVDDLGLKKRGKFGGLRILLR